LEHELADLHRKQAHSFTSGYVSNQTGIATIAKLVGLPDLSDELNLNSMIEGVRQSGCEEAIWHHNDVGHLERLLQAAGQARPKRSYSRPFIPWMATWRRCIISAIG
jgi:5-aminolevulinate synthase